MDSGMAEAPLGEKVGKHPSELAAEGNAGGILKPITRAARVQGGPALAATLHFRWNLKPHSSGSAWVLFPGSARRGGPTTPGPASARGPGRSVRHRRWDDGARDTGRD
jgi:hypothetical protein